MKHVMLDLESLGTRPGSVILSIGAVEFDPTLGLGEEFYEVINIESSKAAGLTTDQSTLDWWAKQSPEARVVLSMAEAEVDSVDVHQALMDFASWFPKGAQLWGNGANFDNVLLAAAYEKCELNYPARFFNDMCYRTLRKIALSRIGGKRSKPVVAHHALEDAKAQALDAVTMLAFLEQSNFVFAA